MFDDHWRTCCQSQDSAKKRTVKTPYFWRSTILWKYPEIHILPEDKSSQKEEAKGAAGGTPPGGAGEPPAAPPWGEATLAHFCHCPPPTYIVIPKNLSRGRIRDRHRRLRGAENTEREKLSGSAREIPSRRGEIVAIIITIALDFIGIIITIIIVTSTFISTITTPSRYNILG
jgi:hypothetical protein